MIRVSFDREPEPRELPTLFARGMAWQRAANSWAAAQGLTVERFAIDQRFRAGGAWYSIDWNKETELWDVKPVA